LDGNLTSTASNFSIDAGGNITFKDDVTFDGSATVSGTLKLNTVSSLADNSSVLTVDSGIVKYIDTSTLDKSTTNELQNIFFNRALARSNAVADTTTIILLNCRVNITIQVRVMMLLPLPQQGCNCNTDGTGR
jgi:hypothetical protein